MDLVNRPGLDVSGTISDVNRLVSVAAANEIKESLISDGVTAGVLTIAKTGSTARIVTFPDAEITVARIDAAQTFTGQSIFTDGIKSTHCDAYDVSGMHIGNNSHQDVAMFGAGGGQGTTLYGQLNCLAVDSTSATGILTRQAATQDSIKLLGRAGGTGSYVLTLTPTTLTASRTATFPDASIVVAGSASALTSGRIPYATTGGLLVDTASLTYTSNQLTVGDGTSTAFFYSKGASGSLRGSVIQTTTTNRWLIAADASTESGSDAGSAFVINAYNDAGSTLDTPFKITRAAGGTITLARPVSITNTTASTTTATGALVVSGGGGFGGNVNAGGTIGSAGDVTYTKSGSGVISLLQTGATTGTTVGAKDQRLMFRLDSSTGNAGGEIVWAASADSNVERWAAISGKIATNGAGGASGGIAFYTKAADADTSLTERMNIQANGGVTITGFVGLATTATNAAAAVTVGTVNPGMVGTTQVAIYAGLANTSAATTRVSSFYSGPTMTDAAYTCSYFAHFDAFTMTVPANVTVTSWHGLIINTPTFTGTVTNAYGIRSIIASGSNRYNLYCDGTAANYLAGATTVANSLLSTSATGGIGYGTGAGGTVTQATSRTTGVTLDKVCGAITLVSAAGSTTPASFTVTCSAVAATDTVVLSQKSGTDKYVLLVTAVAAGSFQITAYTTGGTTTEQPVINYAIVKAVAS